tara:strand:- start:227 stop:862 length:636 start_codon:yes stop_codon:yes gene_type:complete
VIFDLDGVLVDSKEEYLKSWIVAAHHFGVHHLGEDELFSRMNAPVDVQVRYILGDAYTSILAKELLAYRHKQRLASPVENMTLYVGAKDMLQRLVARGSVLALCTNKPHDFAHIILAECGISEYFSYVRGVCSGVRPKPSPEMIYAILKESGAAPHSTIFIGDSVSDVYAARKAGIASGVACWGYTTKSVLLAAKPDYVFATCESVARQYE